MRHHRRIVRDIGNSSRVRKLAGIEQALVIRAIADCNGLSGRTVRKMLLQHLPQSAGLVLRWQFDVALNGAVGEAPPFAVAESGQGYQGFLTEALVGERPV